MTAQELGMTDEGMAYVDAILYLNHEGIGFKYRRARLRISIGCGDEEDYAIVQQYEGRD